MTLTTETRGQRVYVLGNTYAVRDALKRAGCHWDGDARAWWIGVAKRAAIESLVSQPMAVNGDVAEDRLARDRENILGTAKYDGHSYYMVGRGRNERGEWVRLLFRDGSKTFFKPLAEAEITKTYRKPMTLAALQEFAERRKRENETGVCECWCHRSHDCTCGDGFCLSHHDGCDRCGCEN